jgi:isopentenyl phosphate kinase
MRVFIKLGGSMITDKRQESVFREAVVRQIAAELKSALAEDSYLQILIGHGSGSFGHVVAKRYGTVQGVYTQEEWRGYAKVANVAAELNYLVVKILEDEGLPVLRVQPSASLMACDGKVKGMAVAPIEHALSVGLIPVVFGDVSLDEVRGGTIISTEALFFYLAEVLRVDQILLVGEVEGVFGLDGAVIDKITPQTLSRVEAALGGSHGTDVTGGMATKVREMVSLVCLVPRLSIRILGDLSPGLLSAVLVKRAAAGTLISAS